VINFKFENDEKAKRKAKEIEKTDQQFQEIKEKLDSEKGPVI
jgi:hypothetical protein